MKVILFWLLISYTTSLHLHSSIPVLKRDLVTVDVTTPSTDHQRSKRHADQPDVLHIHISNNQFDRSFHVEKYQDDELNTPVYIDGKLFQEDPYPKIFTQFYRCIDRGCLIQAQKAIDLNTTNVFSDYLLFGTFEIDGQLHVLDHTENGEHVIAIPEESDFDCQVSSVHQEHDENVQIPELEMRQKRASSNYQVELLIVLDYSSYQFWLTAKKGVRTDAIDAIKQFYAFMVKGMDLRYENIRSATFSMDVLLAGLYVIENANSASFIEDIKNCSTGAPCKVDSNVVLARFQSWVQTNTTSLPHDHAMFFTRYDISTNGNNNATGYAYLGSMCSDQSVSVVEENFSFISQTIAAHELGHSLSAVHDGDQNLCSAADHYIMAASSFASLGSTAQNPWMFSTCSSAEIGARINILVSSTNNCLITSVATNPKSLDSYLSQNIGQIYSADQQCKLALGEASYSCRNQYPTADSFQSVCVGLWCKSTTLINQCSLILPAERTSCGSQKWCEGYLCVTSPQAPAMPANCIFGDQSGDIVSGYNCSSFIKTFPYRCYDPAYATPCCQSCNSIATGITDCEYGDRADCSAVTNCYDNALLCCLSCKSKLTTIPNCQYGDRTDCGKITFGFQCYAGNNSNLCCQSCNQYKTAISGCEYGDKASGCKSESCSSYSENDRNLCCKTCAGIVIISSTTTSAETTTRQSSNPLPSWVLPVAISAGAIVLLTLIVVIVCCIRMSRRAAKDNDKPPFNHRVSHDRIRSDRRQHAQSSNWDRQANRESRDVIVSPPKSRQDFRGDGRQKSRVDKTPKEAISSRNKKSYSNEAMYPQRNVNHHRSYEGGQFYNNSGYNIY